MVTYDRLCKKPTAFPALTGLTREEFDRLYDQFADAEARQRAAATRTRRGRRPLRRAAGAGHPFALDGRARLAMGLVWLRVYPTYEVLGWLFGLDKSNAWHNVQDVLATLQAMACFPLDRPDAQRPRTSPEDVFDAFPEVRLVADATEQSFHRLKGWDNQKPF